MKNKLAMFDMDGTLFDTKDVNYYAYKKLKSIKLNEGLRGFFFSSIVDCPCLNELAIPKSVERIIKYEGMPNILYGYDNLYKSIKELDIYDVIDIGDNCYKFVKK